MRNFKKENNLVAAWIFGLGPIYTLKVTQWVSYFHNCSVFIQDDDWSPTHLYDVDQIQHHTFFKNMPKIKHWLLLENSCFICFQIKHIYIYIIYTNTLSYDHKCSIICFFPTWLSTSVLNNINLFLSTSLLYQKALKWKHISIISLGNNMIYLIPSQFWLTEKEFIWESYACNQWRPGNAWIHFL